MFEIRNRFRANQNLVDESGAAQLQPIKMTKRKTFDSMRSESNEFG